MKIRILFILFLLCIQTTSCHVSGVKEKHRYFQVTKVIDGDTFWVDDGTKKGMKVRLIGVDAPETRRTSRKEVGYYAQESKQYIASLLLDKEVRLEYDVESTDRYGRTLAYVYMKDGTFVNAELVRRGYGMVMTIPPNVRFAEQFVKLQRTARKKETGLWKGQR